MTLTLSGQKPAILSPVHALPINGDYDPIPAIRDSIVKPFFEPLTNGGSVTIVDQQNRRRDEDSILATLMQTVGASVNPQAEAEIMSLLAQGLVNYDQNTSLLVNEMYVVQAAHAHRMPNPGPKTIYTAAHDIIPAARNLLAGNAKDDGALLASIAYTYSPEALGFWFQSSADFDDFKVWLAQQTSALSAVLPADTVNLLNRFAQTNLVELVEGYVLRANDWDGNEEFSFARVIVHMLMQYQQQNRANWGAQQLVGTLPFTISELFLPRTIILVNVEAHGRATPKKVDNEWRLINLSIAQPVKVISNKSLSKLTAAPRAAAKAAAKATAAQSARNQQNARSAKITFKKQPPTTIDILTKLLRVLKHMKEVSRSMNVFKKTRSSFAKANRRDPDDYNRPGKITSTHFLPDLHAFIDTSGSISEANYQQAVFMLIKLAKRLNVDLYFNSFSHVLSQEVVLRTKDKSITRIWQEFRKVPKVTGATEFKQVWDYINASETRKRRLSLMVTDFEWDPPVQRVEHPRNLYYAPCSSMDWDSIVDSATSFAKTMRHIEPAIGQRLIGLVA
ncbi:hypothetical protein SAMN06295974_3843 [Plantibacter flavus]|uniref:Uncharacterized protein n=1 Tax=Plantibacter flavus TaxID=150123 RepID=A0A3N2BL57_9MICO|nr:hypothetical protein [Plantibacter flavus]ROR76011.1 hypothetical protein EDD42_3963 [Plantibacter flavus]SMG49310.1 hypothetical protein SAMN06295974_3843 [Plantibacter flavus]